MTESFLHPDQIPVIEELASKANTETIQRRARILLLYNAGKETREISQTVGLSLRSVQFWRREFLKRGMNIFSSIGQDQVEDQPGETVAQEVTPGKHKPAQPEIRIPKIGKYPGVKPDDPMAEAGRKILGFHFAHMLKHENGTRLGTDIEELHDMRVATRRMRAAFDIFEPYFKPKVAKKHLKGLRATGRALGSVRDLDVFMEKAEQYLEGLPEDERVGLEPLLAAWQQERSTEREKMLAHLDSESYLRFKQDFTDFVSTPGTGNRSSSRTKPEPDLVRHVTPILIYTNLAAVRAYEKVVTNAVIEQLHALRIEFKKLRYTFEFFQEVLGKQSKDVIDDLKSLQDHLGDLNDANVACQLLRDFVETWEKRQSGLSLQERQNPEPVVAYLATKHAEQHKLTVTFPQAWSHFNRQEFRENVALAVSAL